MEKKRISNHLVSFSNSLSWAFCLLLFSVMVLTSCKQDMYENRPNTTGESSDDSGGGNSNVVTDADRVAYAEKVLGITFDKQQDWVLTSANSVKIVADADLDDISQVVVLDAHPYAGPNRLLASKALTKGASVTLSFRAQLTDTVLYAACLSKDGQCIARPFVVGKDTEVSFVEQPIPAAARSGARRSVTEVTPPDAPFYMKDYYSFRNAVKKALPKGSDNRQVIGEFDYTNTIQVRKNPYTTYSLPLVYIGGDSEADLNLAYTWYPLGLTENKDSFLIRDNFPSGWEAKKDFDTGEFQLHGYELSCRHENGQLSHNFTSSDILQFRLMKGEQELIDAEDSHVKVFRFNGYVFIACDEGNDWDYNDRLFWMRYGNDRLEKAKVIPVDPDPSAPQLWTYAWEDKDFGDYDLNDCVIEVQKNADDTTKLDITLVALGAKNNLWLYFDSKTEKSYSKLTPVFTDELHKVLGAEPGTMVNTGQASAKTKTVTLSKPTGFDFQTCSFVLVSQADGRLITIRISTKGQDPHGIVIPVKWQWPTETTCIKDAYPEFVKWAADRTQAQDWYKYPVKDKIVSQ